MNFAKSIAPALGITSRAGGYFEGADSEADCP